eukprot:scaffold18819_cov268-Amphora_coffeaeformis.AAC.6
MIVGHNTRRKTLHARCCRGRQGKDGSVGKAHDRVSVIQEAGGEDKSGWWNTGTGMGENARKGDGDVIDAFCFVEEKLFLGEVRTTFMRRESLEHL